MTRRAIVGFVVGFLATVAALNIFLPSHHYAHTPQACARRLHITWDRADGATERLSAFRACVEGGTR